MDFHGSGLYLTGVFILFTGLTSFVSGRFIDVGAVNLVSCACNTQECRSQGVTRCMATNMCYVQYVPQPQQLTRRNRLTNNAQTSRMRKDNYIRGCINRSTPLLCENRPPALLGQLQADWPVLHCCSSDMCNKNVLPTPPVWMPTTTASPMKRANIAQVKNEAEPRQDLSSINTDRTDHANSDGYPVISQDEQQAQNNNQNDDQSPPARLRITPSSDETDSDEAASENTDESRDLTDVGREEEEEEGQGTLDQIPASTTDDEVEATHILTNTAAPVLLSSASSKLLYIGVPVLLVLLIIMLSILGVLALKRAQFVSTESLVHRPAKQFVQLPSPRCPPPSSSTTIAIHGGKRWPEKSGNNGGLRGHDHVSYISGSSLEERLPEHSLFKSNHPSSIIHHPNQEQNSFFSYQNSTR